jgi:uncharacterized protein YidB (DUF937 family)
MGLFDGISSLIKNAVGLDVSQFAGSLMDTLQQNGISGIGALVTQFEQAGFGEHVASWVGNSDNLPIEANAIQQVLGQPAIAAIAAKLGIDPQQASQLLAQHLPDIVNHLTPNGQVPGGAASA